MKYLYTDGGVVLKNPSTIGGTWAWCLVEDDKVILHDSGHITPKQMKSVTVTNNQTELLAVIAGLSGVRDDEIVEVRSDSEITLGRVFKGYAFNNIPTWILTALKNEKARLTNFKKFTYELMDGHPTQEQVERGIGKKGHVTSKWNVWCDEECKRQARKLLLEQLT